LIRPVPYLPGRIGLHIDLVPGVVIANVEIDAGRLSVCIAAGNFICAPDFLELLRGIFGVVFLRQSRFWAYIFLFGAKKSDIAYISRGILSLSYLIQHIRLDPKRGKQPGALIPLIPPEMADPLKVLETYRSHWSIENSCH